MIGKTLGHYEILEPLGSGAMGKVYRAHDTNLKRDVAIKMLPEDFASDSERLARLERKAQLLASLNHAGIAAIGMSCCDVLALILEAVMPHSRRGF